MYNDKFIKSNNNYIRVYKVFYNVTFVSYNTQHYNKVYNLL